MSTGLMAGIIIAVLGVIVPRRQLVLLLVVTACFVPVDQRIVVAGVDLPCFAL